MPRGRGCCWQSIPEQYERMPWGSRCLTAVQGPKWAFGRNKKGAMVLARWCYWRIFMCTTEIVKNCDVWQSVNTYKVWEGNWTLHPMTVSVKVWSKIGIDLIRPIKEHYRYIVTAISYTTKYAGAEPLKEKTCEALQLFFTNYS